MLTPIPTYIGDPAARLAAAHEAMRSAKERHKAVPATVLQDANEVIPPALFAQAARVTMSVAARHPGQAPVNTVISNVPGRPPRCISPAPSSRRSTRSQRSCTASA